MNSRISGKWKRNLDYWQEELEGIELTIEFFLYGWASGAMLSRLIAAAPALSGRADKRATLV